MNQTTKKHILYRIILGDYSSPIHSLETYFEANIYRLVMKCPTELFLFGIIDTCKCITLGGQPVEITLDDIKILLPEMLSDINGFETTYTDEDWINLEIIESKDGRFVRRNFNSNKAFMSDFFEW